MNLVNQALYQNLNYNCPMGDINALHIVDLLDQQATEFNTRIYAQISGNCLGEFAAGFVAAVTKASAFVIGMLAAITITVTTPLWILPVVIWQNCCINAQEEQPAPHEESLPDFDNNDVNGEENRMVPYQRMRQAHFEYAQLELLLPRFNMALNPSPFADAPLLLPRQPTSRLFTPPQPTAVQVSAPPSDVHVSLILGLVLEALKSQPHRSKLLQQTLESTLQSSNLKSDGLQIELVEDEVEVEVENQPSTKQIKDQESSRISPLEPKVKTLRDNLPAINTRLDRIAANLKFSSNTTIPKEGSYRPAPTPRAPIGPQLRQTLKETGSDKRVEKKITQAILFADTKNSGTEKSAKEKLSERMAALRNQRKSKL